MEKYETIKPSEVLDENGEVTTSVGVGKEYTGEPIEIDGSVYLQTEDGYILMENLAKVVETPKEEIRQIEEEVKGRMSASTKKLIFALVGLALGFGIAKYRKMSTKGIVLAAFGGIAVGLFADYLHNKRLEK
jgi:hypothetical protein